MLLRRERWEVAQHMPAGALSLQILTGIPQHYETHDELIYEGAIFYAYRPEFSERPYTGHTTASITVATPQNEPIGIFHVSLDHALDDRLIDCYCTRIHAEYILHSQPEEESRWWEMVTDIQQQLTVFAAKYLTYAPRFMFGGGWQKSCLRRIPARSSAEQPRQLLESSESTEQLQSMASVAPTQTTKKGLDSAHFAFPREKRKAIVEHFRADHRKGLSIRREDWARQKYGITWRTLKAYLREFPEDDVPSPA
jgi:hypothetical protein